MQSTDNSSVIQNRGRVIRYSCPECHVQLLEIRTDSAVAYLVCRNRRCKQDVLLTVDGDNQTLVVGDEAKDRDRDVFNTIRCPKCNRFVMDIRAKDAIVSVVCADKRCKGKVGIEMSATTLSVSVSK